MSKITILIDNQSESKEYMAEHGLALYIESDESRILFDTGASSSFISNAKKMGVDLSLVDTLVISHGHYDHTGGLSAFLEINKSAKLVLKSEALLPKYKKSTYIGIPEGIDIPQNRMVFVDDLYAINNSVSVVGDITINHPDATQFENFNVEVAGKIYPDKFRDELFMVIRENDGLTVITACSHNGIINIIETAEARFKMPVKKVIGGFHLKNSTESSVIEITDFFNASNIELVATCHCTGYPNFSILKQHFSGITEYAFAGKTLTE